MATTTTPTKTPTATKPAREKKAPVAVNVRIIEALKRGALAGKLTAEQLDKIGELAVSLKVFIQS